MKPVMFCISIFSMIFISNLFGQDSTAFPLLENKFALQFQLTNSFMLQPFQGSALSCKYHIRDESAIRFGIALSGSAELESKVNNTDDVRDREISIELNIQYMHYLKTVDDISMYAGSGPSYTRYFSNYPSSYSQYNNWSIGLTGIIGVEWFFKKNMSLSGEYGLLIGYAERQNTDSEGDDYFQRRINVNSSNQFKVGLGVYL